MSSPSTSRIGCFAALIAVTLGGCAGDANPVRDLALASGITGGEPKPAPDFVTRTRPANLDYMPIGVAPPPRKYRAKDNAAVAGAEAEMNELRTANEKRGAAARRAGATPAPAPVRVPRDTSASE